MRHTSSVRNSLRSKRGFTVITVTIFIVLILAFALTMLTLAMTTNRVELQQQSLVDATQIADAAIQKAVFCLNATSGSNCGGTFGANYAGETNVSFADGKFTSVISGSGATRIISVTATTASGAVRRLAMDLTTIPRTDNPGFSYALQSGGGGAYLENNSGINGTIYSNGDIICQQTNAYVTGDAYVTKVGGQIDNCGIAYQAHADRVLNSKVDGDAYYKNDPTDVAGTTVPAGHKHPNSATPAAASLPAVNLEFWREVASAGGVIEGNYAPADNSTLGPVEITGDLFMDNNIDITITGPIWVKGNIITGNSCSFSLDPAFGSYSTVILADDPDNRALHGFVNISNGTGIYGSGDPKSHILFVSTNTTVQDAAPSMTVANNAAGAVFMTTDGVLKLDNNAGAKSLAGYRLYLAQNAVVTYTESDFTGEFSNSPGVTWHIAPGTWREIR